MAEHGYQAGQNLSIERRGAIGRTADLPRLAQELVAARVEVIVTIGYPPAVAAKATGIPTVAASGVGDPVATGLVESLARPGGTVTGISDNATELSTKRLGPPEGASAEPPQSRDVVEPGRPWHDAALQVLGRGSREHRRRSSSSRQ